MVQRAVQDKTAKRLENAAPRAENSPYRATGKGASTATATAKFPQLKLTDDEGEGQPDRRAQAGAPQQGRRAAPQSKRNTAGEPIGPPQYHLPASLRSLALALLFAFELAAIAAGSLPPLGAIVAAIVAVMLLSYGFKLAQRERAEGTGAAMRAALVAIGVGLPMALVGIVFAIWVEAGLAWQWALGTLLCINAACFSVFASRTLSLFTAKIALWSAFVLMTPSPIAVSSLIAGVFALILIARYEHRAHRQRLVKNEARERVAARAEDILRSFEDSGQGWFWETDRRGLITYISPSAAGVLGLLPEDLHGQPLAHLINGHSGAAEAERTLAFHLSARSAFQEIEVRAASPNEERWWALTGRPVYDSFKNFCGFRGHGADLTEKRRSEQQVTRLAHYDSLTGLANRVQMSEALEQILAAPRERDRACCVLMLDLDRFKQVNDTLGHPAGDALLKQVASRLKRVLGSVARCGRLGGDEFQVLLPGHTDREEIGHLAREIIAALSQPYSIEGKSVVIGVSIGIAISPDDGSTSEALVRNVDLALYAAKDAGRGVHSFYAADLHSAAEERAELEQDLREASARGDLELYYQPVVFAADEKIVGFEALMRWNHPKRGWISPGKFIPIAEDAGLIDQLGQWALRKACADLARWPESIRCAVNVSPLQFSNPQLPNIVANALAHSGVKPARLELEITESVFLNDSAGTDAMFKALKRVGVRLALDDFGTGYSSLGYLKKAPFDKIKIDQSFVRGATEHGSRNGAIINSITSLAEALSMDTTAEGVETLDELELVRILGCSQVQGNIYFEPLDSDAALELVRGTLEAKAEGFQAARSPRKVLLRRVMVIIDGERHTGIIRNISEGGAMLEGIWNLSVGTALKLEFGADQRVNAEVRWAADNRVGIRFPEALRLREDGTFVVLGAQWEAIG